MGKITTTLRRAAPRFWLGVERTARQSWPGVAALSANSKVKRSLNPHPARASVNATGQPVSNPFFIDNEESIVIIPGIDKLRTGLLTNTIGDAIRGLLSPPLLLHLHGSFPRLPAIYLRQ
jgi:hypothetical protein